MTHFLLFGNSMNKLFVVTKTKDNTTVHDRLYNDILRSKTWLDIVNFNF